MHLTWKYPNTSLIQLSFLSFYVQRNKIDDRIVHTINVVGEKNNEYSK